MASNFFFVFVMAMDTKKLQQINVDTYSPVLTQHELNGTRQGRSNI